MGLGGGIGVTLTHFRFSSCLGQAGDRANLVKTSGDAAADDARDTLIGVQDIVDDLPEQLAKTKPLVNNVVATNRDINLARTQGKEDNWPSNLWLSASTKDSGESALLSAHCSDACEAQTGNP